MVPTLMCLGQIQTRGSHARRATYLYSTRENVLYGVCVWNGLYRFRCL